MLRQRQLRLLALLAAGGGGSYALYRYSQRQKEPKAGDTFRIPIRQRDANGKRFQTVMELPYLQDAVLEKRVKTFSRNLFTETIPPETSHASAVINFSGAQLNSNDPIEDMEPEAIVYAYENSTRRPLIVAAVADGHSGPYTSAWLKGQLSNLMIGTLLMSNGFKISFPPLEKQTGTIPIPSAFKLNPKEMEGHIKKSFIAVDQYLVWQMPKVLMEQLAGKAKNSTEPSSKMVGQILPGYSGACALTAVVDTEEQQMWVAVAGDCRAVAGFYDQEEDGSGTWRVDVLSEDQTAESPKEVARIISEHPKDNPAEVIAGGRVLGSLQPSRSFGDLRYKWTVEAQNNVLPKILPPEIKQRPPPRNLNTPPYVTAEPEVQYRKFNLPSSPSDSTKSTLRFLILATDGLWDQLSSNDAVALVAAHISGQRGSIPRPKLLKQLPLVEDHATKTSSPLPHTAKAAENVKWAFRDESLGMHLIRNACGGDDEVTIRQTLSIPAPYSRRFRDDITVAVITFESAPLPNNKVKVKL